LAAAVQKAPKTMTLEQILERVVDDFIDTRRENAHLKTKEFQKLPSLKDAIHRACQKVSRHQDRIPKSVLQAAERRLQKAADILASAESFEDLHTEIERIIRGPKIDGRRIGGIRRIGRLTVYDIAHRIGAFLRKPPKLVYLHRGTRDGARHLGLTGKTLDPRELREPFPAFARLTPAEIEDCLCIYKDELASPSSGPRPPDPRRRMSRTSCAGPPVHPQRVCRVHAPV
jgi:hypothetical protein